MKRHTQIFLLVLALLQAICVVSSSHLKTTDLESIDHTSPFSSNPLVHPFFERRLSKKYIIRGILLSYHLFICQSKKTLALYTVEQKDFLFLGNVKKLCNLAHANCLIITSSESSAVLVIDKDSKKLSFFTFTDGTGLKCHEYTTTISNNYDSIERAFIFDKNTIFLVLKGFLLRNFYVIKVDFKYKTFKTVLKELVNPNMIFVNHGHWIAICYFHKKMFQKNIGVLIDGKHKKFFYKPFSKEKFHSCKIFINSGKVFARIETKQGSKLDAITLQLKDPKEVICFEMSSSISLKYDSTYFHLPSDAKMTFTDGKIQKWMLTELGMISQGQQHQCSNYHFEKFEVMLVGKQFSSIVAESSLIKLILEYAMFDKLPIFIRQVFYPSLSYRPFDFWRKRPITELLQCRGKWRMLIHHHDCGNKSITFVDMANNKLALNLSNLESSNQIILVDNGCYVQYYFEDKIKQTNMLGLFKINQNQLLNSIDVKFLGRKLFYYPPTKTVILLSDNSKLHFFNIITLKDSAKLLMFDHILTLPHRVAPYDNCELVGKWLIIYQDYSNFFHLYKIIDHSDDKCDQKASVLYCKVPGVSKVIDKEEPSLKLLGYTIIDCMLFQQNPIIYAFFTLGYLIHIRLPKNKLEAQKVFHINMPYPQHCSRCISNISPIVKDKNDTIACFQVYDKWVYLVTQKYGYLLRMPIDKNFIAEQNLAYLPDQEYTIIGQLFPNNATDSVTYRKKILYAKFHFFDKNEDGSKKDDMLYIVVWSTMEGNELDTEDIPATPSLQMQEFIIELYS